MKTNQTLAAQYRQGDVMLVRIPQLPEGLKKIPLVKGKLVLKEGKEPGRAHIIVGPGAEQFQDADGNRFVRMKGKAISTTRSFDPHNKQIVVTLPKLGLGKVHFNRADVNIVGPTAKIKGSFDFLQHDAGSPDHEILAIPAGSYRSPSQRQPNGEDANNVID